MFGNAHVGGEAKIGFAGSLYFCLFEGTRN